MRRIFVNLLTLFSLWANRRYNARSFRHDRGALTIGMRNFYESKEGRLEARTNYALLCWWGDEGRTGSAILMMREMIGEWWRTALMIWGMSGRLEVEVILWSWGWRKTWKCRFDDEGDEGRTGSGSASLMMGMKDELEVHTECRTRKRSRSVQYGIFHQIGSGSGSGKDKINGSRSGKKENQLKRKQ